MDLIKIIRSKKLEATFPNIDVVLRMFLSTAATNCSGERSFSTLKRIKNVHRSTMGQERLSALTILQIECHVLQNIDVDNVIDRFSEIKCCRKMPRE